MKCLVVLLAFVALAHCAAQNPAAFAAGGEDDDYETPILVCDPEKKILGPDDELKGKLAKCFDPKVYGDGPGKKPLKCNMFCQNRAFGLLEKNGLPSTRVYDKWVDTKFPSQHRRMAKAHFKDCYERFGSKLIKGDRTCKYAEEFNTCNWSVQPKLTC